MADLLKGLFGGQKPLPSASPVAVGDSGTSSSKVCCILPLTTTPLDFADFAGAPDPSPISVLANAATSSISSAMASPTAIGAFNPGIPMSARPYTKWYRVWERSSIADFYTEMFIVPFILIIIIVHFWGTRANKRKAKSWGAAHIPLIQQEYASVGFSGRGGADLKMLEDATTLDVPEDVLRENAPNEFITYATGRQNVAFLDVRLGLAKRYNPMARIGEEALGLFFESMPAPKERMEATAYTFDGKEADILGAVGTEATKGGAKSGYDGFVWAIVHKDMMQALRNSRYDLSLTYTKDSPKLPNWATIMSESAEITDTLLTPALIEAVEQAGERLESLIITDQPVDKPVTYVL